MAVKSSAASPTRSQKARERILSTAYELFSQQGTRSVGIDTIVEKSGVAKMTLYHHFPSKRDLVLAFMEQREELWTLDWLFTEVRKRAKDPRDRLLAIFDAFHDWFKSENFEGCSFINVLLEYPSKDELHDRAALHLKRIRGFLNELAVEACLNDPQILASTWHMMMKGSIVAAREGNGDAAAEAKMAAAIILDHWPKQS